MGFFRKFKKLKFWTKRGKRVEKSESKKEDLEPNLKLGSSEHVEPKLNGEEDVELNLLEHIEELRRKLEEKDATICGLQKIVEEQNIEREQVEATLRGRVTALEEKLEERDREREEVKATIDALPGQIKELKQNIRKVQYDQDHKYFKHYSELIQLEEKFVDAYRGKNAAESELGNLREYYERKQQERDAKSENVEGTLNGMIKSLQKQLEEADRLEREHKEYCEMKQQERDAENRKVIDNLNRVITRQQKELQEAASKRNENKVPESDRKEGETTGCGRMKKLVAVAVVTVVVLLMVVSFFQIME